MQKNCNYSYNQVYRPIVEPTGIISLENNYQKTYEYKDTIHGFEAWLS